MGLYVPDGTHPERVTADYLKKDPCGVAGTGSPFFVD